MDYDEVPEHHETLRQRFHDEIFPVLTPLAVDPGHPFPYISTLSLSIAVGLADPETGEKRFARVKIPPILPRLFPVGRDKFVLLDQVIEANLDELFRGMEILETHLFRVTRDADIAIEEDEADDLLLAIEEEIRRRRFGEAVRLEVERSMPEVTRQILIKGVGVLEDDSFEVAGMLDLTSLWQLVGLDRPDLKSPAHTPVIPQRLLPPDEDELADVFAQMRAGDVFLHHPYESFTASVERFIDQAADDPEVLTIKQTLYRTSGDSPIVQALIRAAERGKQVVVLVEIKARFDEENNIGWGRRLEQAGAHVVYGLVGLKTHSKVALVVRREGTGLRRYIHIGTGNYNSKTARLYTDLGLLTCREELGADVTDLFNVLTGLSRQRSFRRLLVAPMTLRGRILELIERETALARAGQPGADRRSRSTRSSTSRSSRRCTRRRRPASRSTASCAARAASSRVSRTSRSGSASARSSASSSSTRRIFMFANGGRPEWFIGSADLMERNLDRRVEVVTPVEDHEAQARLARIIEVMLADDRRSWQLQPDGRWLRSEIVQSVEGSVDTFAVLKERCGDRRGTRRRPAPAPRRSGLDGPAGMTDTVARPMEVELKYRMTDAATGERLARRGRAGRARCARSGGDRPQRGPLPRHARRGARRRRVCRPPAQRRGGHGDHAQGAAPPGRGRGGAPAGGARGSGGSVAAGRVVARVRRPGHGPRDRRRPAPGRARGAPAGPPQAPLRHRRRRRRDLGGRRRGLRGRSRHRALRRARGGAAQRQRGRARAAGGAAERDRGARPGRDVEARASAGRGPPGAGGRGGEAADADGISRWRCGPSRPDGWQRRHPSSRRPTPVRRARRHAAETAVAAPSEGRRGVEARAASHGAQDARRRRRRPPGRGRPQGAPLPPRPDDRPRGGHAPRQGRRGAARHARRHAAAASGLAGVRRARSTRSGPGGTSDGSGSSPGTSAASATSTSSSRRPRHTRRPSPVPEAAAFEPLIQSWRVQRDAARVVLLHELDSGRYRKWVDGLHRVRPGGGPGRARRRARPAAPRPRHHALADLGRVRERPRLRIGDALGGRQHPPRPPDRREVAALHARVRARGARAGRRSGDREGRRAAGPPRLAARRGRRRRPGPRRTSWSTRATSRSTRAPPSGGTSWTASGSWRGCAGPSGPRGAACRASRSDARSGGSSQGSDPGPAPPGPTLATVRRSRPRMARPSP